MGTTSNFNLPYPESGDLVIQGDDAIQALAESVDATLNNWSSLAQTLPAGSGATIPGSGVAVGFSGTATLVDFTYDTAAGAFIYHGAPRPFIIAASVSIETGIGGGTSTASTIEVRHNGVAIMGSNHESYGDAAQDVTHTVTVPALLQTGDIIDVIGYSAPNGTLGVNAIRIYPIGPAA